MSEASFQVDPDIAEVAEAYALDAVDIAGHNFRVALDWSEDSIRRVEQILGRLHDDIANSQPPEDTIWKFAKSFGSYIGEVLRRRHGGEWGIVSTGSQEFPGLQQAGGALCWPWGKAYNRLTKGPEDNVWHYYQVLVERPA
jgi:hypothetical protein